MSVTQAAEVVPARVLVSIPVWVITLWALVAAATTLISPAASVPCGVITPNWVLVRVVVAVSPPFLTVKVRVAVLLVGLLFAVKLNTKRVQVRPPLVTPCVVLDRVQNTSEELALLKESLPPFAYTSTVNWPPLEAMFPVGVVAIMSAERVVPVPNCVILKVSLSKSLPATKVVVLSATLVFWDRSKESS